MFEGLIAIWAILIFFFPVIFNNGSKGKNAEPPKPPVVALSSPSPSPSTFPSSPPSENSKEVPTPALLPGLIVFFGSALRKKGQQDG